MGRSGPGWVWGEKKRKEAFKSLKVFYLFFTFLREFQLIVSVPDNSFLSDELTKTHIFKVLCLEFFFSFGFLRNYLIFVSSLNNGSLEHFFPSKSNALVIYNKKPQ